MTGDRAWGFGQYYRRTRKTVARPGSRKGTAVHVANGIRQSGKPESRPGESDPQAGVNCIAAMRCMYVACVACNAKWMGMGWGCILASTLEPRFRRNVHGIAFWPDAC